MCATMHSILWRYRKEINMKKNITNDNLKIFADNQQDIEANYFALCVLMPRNVFIREFNGIKGDIDYKIQKLAYYFGVSKLAVQVRMNDLNLV